MSRDEIEPMVPILPTEDTSTKTTRSDGGHKTRYDPEDVNAPLVPDLR